MSTVAEPHERNANFAVTQIGTAREDQPRLVWGHGWGQSSAALAPLAEILTPFASSFVIDFPGFGKSPNPPESWGTAEYADAVADWLRSRSQQTIVWIGHSFGGRIGLQLAARHPEVLSGMILIASAGLPRRRSFTQQLRFTLRKYAFRTARRFTPEGPQLDRLRQKFGSSDYRLAGALRPVFVRVVSENLSAAAAKVRCPTLLIYGTADTETPPEIGERLKALIPNSELALLNGFNHLNVLTEGRHQVALRIRKFLETVGAAATR